MAQGALKTGAHGGTQWHTPAMKNATVLIALAACGPLPTPELPQADAGHYTLVDPMTVQRVVDGDTIEVLRGDVTLRVRMKGIDTPELAKEGNPAEAYAEEAKVFSATNVGLQVDLEFDDICGADPFNAALCIDPYDRLLAYVRLADGRDLNEELLRVGLARLFAMDGQPLDRIVQYEAAQRAAQQANTGIWSR
jgi:micrococcal nuclease